MSNSLYTQGPSPLKKGPADYLSDEEKEQMQRWLSAPEDFPPKFKTWILDHQAVNGFHIPGSQIIGFTQFQAKHHEVPATIVFSNVAYGSANGPIISGLSSGQYIFLFGAYMEFDADRRAFMSLSFNGGAGNDTDACTFGHDGEPGDQIRSTVSRAVFRELSSDNSQVEAVYRSWTGASVVVANRWLISLKVGN